MIRADEVMPGDELLVARSDGSLIWDKVAIDKNSERVNMTYLQIEADNGKSITITANHYMHSGPTCCDSASLVTAGNISVGDTIWTYSDSGLAPAKVTVILHVQYEGAYNFLLDQAGDTHFRSLIANGVVASSFTTEWRLIDTFGFDASDQLRDPLRKMARLAGGTLRLSPELTRAAVNVTRHMEDVLADCLENHLLYNCSESDIEAKMDVLYADAQTVLPVDFHEHVGRLVEQLGQDHLSYLPTPLRRLTEMVVSVTMGRQAIVKTAAHEAYELAIKTCAQDSSCAADMGKAPVSSCSPEDSTRFKWFAIGAASMLAMIVVILTVAVGVNVYMRKRKAEKTNEAEVEAQGQPV